MKQVIHTLRVLIASLILVFGLGASGMAAEKSEDKPITLKTMGSLAFGGTVQKEANGDTFHGDHGYAQYYIPHNARQYPLIMWHGMGQSGRSWESTPDGREGFQAIFPRRDWPVYIIDQPRRGRAGYTKAAQDNPDAHPTSAREGGVWNAFRNGVWEAGQAASLYPGVQFPADPASIDQFFRQQTFNTGVEPANLEHRRYMGDTMASLLDLTGPAVLITHSNSGQYGWFTAMATDKIKAVVAYEPGQFVFPEDEQLTEIPFRNALANERLQPIRVPAQEFQKLTRIPIIVVYGDNISEDLSEVFNVEVWRIASARARDFVDTVNRHGGDATLVLLPHNGIKGNTHAPFADRNNLVIADHLEAWLRDKKLDGRNVPHQGPDRKIVELTIPLQQ